MAISDSNTQLPLACLPELCRTCVSHKLLSLLDNVSMAACRKLFFFFKVEEPVILEVIPEPYLMLQNPTGKGVEL